MVLARVHLRGLPHLDLDLQQGVDLLAPILSLGRVPEDRASGDRIGGADRVLDSDSEVSLAESQGIRVDSEVEERPQHLRRPSALVTHHRSCEIIHFVLLVADITWGSARWAVHHVSYVVSRATIRGSVHRGYRDQLQCRLMRLDRHLGRHPAVVLELVHLVEDLFSRGVDSVDAPLLRQGFMP